MNPIGLTQAEEASQQPTEAAPTVRALPGQPSCPITLPPDGAACGAAVECRIVWPGQENESTLACRNCAIRMTQLAESHRTALRVEPLPGR